MLGKSGRRIVLLERSCDSRKPRKRTRLVTTQVRTAKETRVAVAIKTQKLKYNYMTDFFISSIESTWDADLNIRKKKKNIQSPCFHHV